MTAPTLDEALSPRRGGWRPTVTFMAELAGRLEEVDARLSAEAARIPQEGARRAESVLFSLRELRAGDDPRHPSPPPAYSGLLDLRRSPPRARAPRAAPPRTTATTTRRARGARRLGGLLSAVATALASLLRRLGASQA